MGRIFKTTWHCLAERPHFGEFVLFAALHQAVRAVSKNPNAGHRLSVSIFAVKLDFSSKPLKSGLLYPKIGL
jgi:hypothetical protein